MTSTSGNPAGEAGRTLDSRILRGSAWVALGWGGRHALTMVSMLVLARLLEPRAFGVVAVAVTIVTVLAAFQESGMGAALIYRSEDVRRAAASALVFSSCAGLVLAAGLFLLGPSLARLLGLPEAADVIRAMSLLVLIRGVSVGPGAILERDLDFRSRAKGELAGAVTQVVLAVSLAFAGFGVWSLVAGHIAGAAVQSAVFWTVVPWRPPLRQASWRTVRDLARYGRFVAAGNLIVLANRTLDTFVVARVLGATALGFYTVGYRLADFPTAVVGYVVGRVMFPAYARLRDDEDAFRRAFVQNLQRVALLSLPIAVGLVVAAEPIVLALLGPRWLAVVDPLRILALYTIVRSFVSPCGAVFQGAGKPQLVPLWALPHALVFLPALLFLVPRFGLAGAALAMLAGFSASGIPALVVAMRLVRLHPVELARALAPSFLCAGLLGVACGALLPLAGSLSPPAGLALLVAAGGAVYLGATAVFARGTVAPMWTSLRSPAT